MFNVYWSSQPKACWGGVCFTALFIMEILNAQTPGLAAESVLPDAYQSLPRTPQLCTVLILSLPLQDSQERKRGLLSRGWHTSRPEQLFWTGHLVSVAVTSSEKVGWVSVEPFAKGAVEMSVHVWLGYTSKMSGWRHRRSSGKPPRRKEFDALHPHPLSCVALCLYAHACVFTGTGIC